MGKFIVVVLDGFGVGAMEDVCEVRPEDVNSNTFLHILNKKPHLKLPTLENLGIMNIADCKSEYMNKSETATFGKAMLKHYGADTFFGHQEIMGTRPVRPFGEAIKNKLDLIYNALTDKGYNVKYYDFENRKLLIAEDALTIADNIECDLGQAVNITVSIDKVDFEKALEIGRIVRNVTTVPRVITFGGKNVSIDNILGAIEIKGDEFIGVNAPLSGVYKEGYVCVHFGYGINADVQAQTSIGENGIPVYFLGKVADVCENRYGKSYTIVDTDEVLKKTLEVCQNIDTGFICCNVQETDLAGHEQDVEKYVEKLSISDKYISKIIDCMNTDDILVVMADHGNDPLVGHSKHTRECVPLMVYGKKVKPTDLGIRKTLSDVGATACKYFNAKMPENGESFLGEIL